jgi:hypothetical protein
VKLHIIVVKLHIVVVKFHIVCYVFWEVCMVVDITVGNGMKHNGGGVTVA